jgi:hypothetical protein
MMIAYAVSEGRTAALRFAVIVTDPHRNKNGQWKVRVRDVYAPRARTMRPEDARNTTIDANRRVYVIEESIQKVRDYAKIVDAESRLGNT